VKGRGMGKMDDRGGFERGARVFICRSELGLWWASSEAIGRRGQFLQGGVVH
jgi:hypothetical protein